MSVGTVTQAELDRILPLDRAGGPTRAQVMEALQYMGGIGARDLSAHSYMEDDFLAAAIDARWSSTAGAGTANAAAATVAGAKNGQITLKTASDDGTHAQNGSTLTTDQLNYTADQGGLTLEVRCKISALTTALFIGFTDTISTTVELPIFMNAADLDSDADNACGIIFDPDATTDVWYIGGVKATVDTTPSGAGALVPVADTFFIARVEVDATGTCRGWINNVPIGNPVPNAVTITTPLTPMVTVSNRTAAQVTLTVDYISVRANR